MNHDIQPDSCFVYRERRFATWLDAAKARAADRLYAVCEKGHVGPSQQMITSIIENAAADKLKLANLIEALHDLHRGEP